MRRKKATEPRRDTGRRVRSHGVRLAEAKALVEKLEARQEIQALRNKLRSMTGRRRSS